MWCFGQQFNYNDYIYNYLILYTIFYYFSTVLRENIITQIVWKIIVLGIIYLIHYKDMIFILYLAVNEEIRSKGYGSYLLKWIFYYQLHKQWKIWKF